MFLYCKLPAFEVIRQARRTSQCSPGDERCGGPTTSWGWWLCRAGWFGWSGWSSRASGARCSPWNSGPGGSSYALLWIPCDRVTLAILAEQTFHWTEPVAGLRRPSVAIGDVGNPFLVQIEDVAVWVIHATSSQSLSNNGKSMWTPSGVRARLMKRWCRCRSVSS